MGKKNQPEDDRMPWEFVEPSCWLREPYFKTDDPDWIVEVKEIVRDGRDKKSFPEKPLLPTDIQALEYILAGYIQTYIFWEGFLSKGDRDKLEQLKRQADALHKTVTAFIAAQDDEESSRPLPLWYLSSALKNASDGLTLDDLEHVLAILAILANFEIKSPRFEGPETKVSPEKGAATRTKPGKMKGSPWSPTEKNARAKLQVDVDDWWSRVTGLPKAKDQYKAAAFSNFLKATFGRIKLTNPPGYSEHAVAKARKEAAKARDDEKEYWARFNERLARNKKS